MAELKILLEANGAFPSRFLQDLLNQTSAISSSSVSTAENLNVYKTVLASTDSNSNANTGYGSGNINDNNTTNISMDSTGNRAANVNLTAGQRKPEVETSVSALKSGAKTGADPNANVVSVVDVDNLLLEVKESLSEESRKLMLDQVTLAVVEAHLTTTINTHANVAEANEKFQKAVNEGPDPYSPAINANNLWQHFMSAMLPEITKVVTFCTKLPGFSEVGQEDKMRLIKQGCFEVMATRFCLLVDHINEEMIDPTLMMKAPRQIVQDTPMGEFLDKLFTIASQFNPLGLTDEEIGLFTAILMLSPDREGLTNRDSIKLIQQLFKQSLYLLLKQNHADADQTLCKLFKMVPIINQINEQHLKFLKMIKMKSPTEFENKFPQLHKEIFDSSC